jgi:biotin operon repressor
MAGMNQRQQALKMHEEHPYMSGPAIAAALGVDRSTVYRWLHPGRPSHWKMTASCPNCGAPMHVESQQCRACFVNVERREEVIRRYNEGQTAFSIAFALGEDRDRIERYIQKLKQRGFILRRSEMRRGVAMRDVKRRSER